MGGPVGVGSEAGHDGQSEAEDDGGHHDEGPEHGDVGGDRKQGDADEHGPDGADVVAAEEGEGGSSEAERDGDDAGHYDEAAEDEKLSDATKPWGFKALGRKSVRGTEKDGDV